MLLALLFIETSISLEVMTKNAFKIDSKTGKLSSTRALRAGEKFNLKVRAFDCLNNESFVDADVNIDIVERCLPEWTSNLF